MERPLYVPRYIARCNADNFAEADRMRAIVSYDYMGAAEYEFGAVPGSMAVMRSAVIGVEGETGLCIIKHSRPELIAKRGPYEGRPLFTLMIASKATPEYIEAYETALIELTDENHKTWLKEPAHFHRSFALSRWDQRNIENLEHFDLWHDIKNHLYFSHSEALILLVNAQLNRDIMIESATSMLKWCAHPDWKVEFVVPTEDGNTRRNTTAALWSKHEGIVVAVNGIESLSVQTSTGEIFEVPPHMLITLPKEAVATASAEAMEKLQAAIRLARL